MLAAQELGLVGRHVTLAHLAGLGYGPLFALFIRALLFVSEDPWRYRLPHAVPLAVYVVAFGTGHLTGEALALGVFASLGAYLALAAADVARYRSVIEQTRSNVSRVPLAWLGFAVAGLLVAYLLDVSAFAANHAGRASSGQVLEALLYAALLAYVTVFIVTVLRYPGVFAAVTLADRELADASHAGRPGAGERSVPTAGGEVAGHEESAVAGAGQSLLADGRRELDAIEAIMQARRPYLRADLTLAELAREIGVPPRRLSQLVNRGHGRNFADWVNRYRLAEAERLLADPSSGIRSVLDALYAAGFSSKSTFNALFKASTGLTPTEFMRRHRPESRAPKN